jgi:L-alanine-DL-glutamate epimerase-like enolase superfamily enzyme
MADANMKWTVEEAIKAAKAFQPFDSAARSSSSTG